MKNLNIAVAGIPNAWSTEMLMDALSERGVTSYIIQLSECCHDLQEHRVTWKGEDLTRLDAVVIKKIGDLDPQHVENRIVMLKALEQSGVHVISSSDAISAAVNRYRMSWLLCEAGITIPRTIVTESVEEAVSAITHFGRAVLKPLFTTKAAGMQLLSARPELERYLYQFKKDWAGPFYLQEFIESSGRDIAVVLLDDRIIGSFCRVAAPGEWKTTTAAGGHYEPWSLDEDSAQLAVKAAKTFGLAFTSVDMVKGPEAWLVYEVSAFGGFRGLWNAYEINAAELYADYVINRINNERTKFS